MAGSITVSSITLDSDNNFSIRSNTGATLFFANTTGIDVANSIGATAITNDKILSVANTKISGLVTASQIANVANTQLTGNIISSQITSNPTLYGNVSVTGVIGVGGATPTTSGFGITFPASQSASTNANTLDDYEEGTFTPEVIGSSTEGTASYTVQIGKYTKIGDRVFINIFLQWSSGTGTGSMNIKGLPFTSEPSPSNQSFSNYNTGVSLPAGHVMQLITGSNSTLVNVNSVPTGGGTDLNVAYDASGLIIVGGNYRAA
jgi:hypothetical protein